MDSENEQSYHQVKLRRFVLDNKNKCQILRNHSSTHVSLAASAILFWKLCWIIQISSGRDGRASKSGRRPIERTGIVLPIPAALLLPQTNWLYVFNIQRASHTIKGDNSKCIFFLRIMPLFRLRFFILYQTPHSRALAPTCSALVSVCKCFQF